MKMKRTEVNPL